MNESFARLKEYAGPPSRREMDFLAVERPGDCQSHPCRGRALCTGAVNPDLRVQTCRYVRDSACDYAKLYDYEALRGTRRLGRYEDSAPHLALD